MKGGRGIGKGLRERGVERGEDEEGKKARGGGGKGRRRMRGEK